MKGLYLLPKSSYFKTLELTCIGGCFIKQILFEPDQTWLVPIVSSAIIALVYSIGTNIYWRTQAVEK